MVFLPRRATEDFDAGGGCRKRSNPAGPESIVQTNAASGIVGPLDMVTTSINATVPPQYVLNPGDTVTIYYWGDMLELTSAPLVLDDRGEVLRPREEGWSTGMSLQQFQKAVQEQLQRELGKNVKVITSMDKLKSIQIFIGGEAFRPGALFRERGHDAVQCPVCRGRPE